MMNGKNFLNPADENENVEAAGEGAGTPIRAELPRSEWAVLWVRTGSEKAVIEKLTGVLDGERYAAFVPKKVKAFFKKNKVVEKQTVEMCFPGYVFIRVAASAECFFRDVYRLAPDIAGAYRFAYYGTDKKDVFIHSHERKGLEDLMNDDFVIEESIGFIVGDRVKITDGPLVGRESSIIRLNKRQRTVVIGTEMMGQIIETQLMLSVVEKV